MTVEQIYICDKCNSHIDKTVPHVIAYNKWHFHRDCFNNVKALEFVKITDQDYVFINGAIYNNTPLTTWNDRNL